MCREPIYQCSNVVHQPGSNDVAQTDAPVTVQAFIDLVQYHDCVQTFSIDDVRLSMASADCQSCRENALMRGPHADMKLDDAATALSLVARYKAYPVADTVLSHLQFSAASPTATKAIFELKRACEGHRTKRLSKNVMARLGSRDARAVEPDEYRALLQVLLEIFFPCDLPFDFTFLPVNAVHLGDCTTLVRADDNGHCVRYARIRLHPVIYSGRCGKLPAKFSVLNAASVDRLSTLLHEICHGFLGLYTCHECSRAEVCQFHGHGFAWQRIANWVEAFAQEKLDLPLKLGRFDSIVCHWGDMEILPSTEEIMRWGLRVAENRL